MDSRQHLRAFLDELRRQRKLGRDYQPRFARAEVAFTWLGALLALSLLSMLSLWSGYPLTAAPMGASSVLLFGYPRSPLAQPRNIVLGNVLAALVSVGLVALFGTAPWVIGLAVGLTIFLGQLLRCLQPLRVGWPSSMWCSTPGRASRCFQC